MFFEFHSVTSYCFSDVQVYPQTTANARLPYVQRRSWQCKLSARYAALRSWQSLLFTAVINLFSQCHIFFSCALLRTVRLILVFRFEAQWLLCIPPAWTFKRFHSTEYVCVVYCDAQKLSDFIHHHHHHISVMELGHLLIRSGLTYPELSSKIYHDSLLPVGE